MTTLWLVTEHYIRTSQVICNRSGVSGICYEHSVSEGIAVVNFIQDILKSILNKDPKDPGYPEIVLEETEQIQSELK